MSMEFKTSTPSHQDEVMIQLDTYICPICQRIFSEPIRTPCGHAYCRNCIIKAIQRVKPSCPLCREDLSEWYPEYAFVDDKLVQELELYFPDQVETRALEDLEEKKAEQYKTQIILSVGNDHETLPQPRGHNQHKWTFFVRSDQTAVFNKIVAKIVVDLHPTFFPPSLTLTTPPYEFHRIGWGIFQLRIHIYFKPQYGKDPIDLTHTLSFNNGGASTTYSLELDSRKLGD